MCMFIMHVHVHVHVQLHMCMRMSNCICACACPIAYVHVHVQLHMCMCMSNCIIMCMCMSNCICACACPIAYVHVHVQLPHAGDWLNGVPSEALGLRLQDREFRVSLRYWLGVPLHSSPYSCPECHATADEFGDHQVGCGGNGDRIYRHNAVRDVLYTAAQSAALAPTREATGVVYLIPSPAQRTSSCQLGVTAVQLRWMCTSSPPSSRVLSMLQLSTPVTHWRSGSGGSSMPI